MPRWRNDPRRGTEHDTGAAGGDDAGECQVAGAQHAGSALLEHMKMPSRQDVLEVDRSARRGRLDDKEAWIALARLLDELAVEVRAGLDLVVEKVQGDRLSRPPWRQVGLGGIRHEGED